MIPLTVNGRTYDLEVLPDTPLLWVIQESLGLTGTKPTPCTRERASGSGGFPSTGMRCRSGRR